jgi:hypothetical protein
MFNKNKSINGRIKELEEAKSGKKSDYVKLIGIKPAKYYRMREEKTEVLCSDIEKISERLHLNTRERVWLFTGIDIGDPELNVNEGQKEEIDKLKKRNDELIDTIIRMSHPPQTTQETANSSPEKEKMKLVGKKSRTPTGFG